MKEKKIHKRKLDHVKIVLEKQVEPLASIWHKYRLPYRALPGIDLEKVDSSTVFFNKKISFPLLISSMTGGQAEGKKINRHLADAAEVVRVPLALGSMRVIIKHPEVLKSFQIRQYCPSIPLFANLGLVQLNYGFGADQINKIIDSIQADGIFLHINALQEAIQPEGDTNFAGLLNKLEKILPKIERPVIVKEVGSGIDLLTAKRLKEIGVQWLDVAGLGGTSWPWVEGYRRNDDLGKLFRAEGIPTDEAITKISVLKGVQTIASGGIRTGLDMAKAIILGAKLTGTAKPLLAPALKNQTECVVTLQKLRREFRIAMFMCGAKTVEDLRALTDIIVENN